MPTSYNAGKISISGTVTANVTGNLPAIGTGQTFVRAMVGNQNTGATVYTATAGKTFTLLGAVLTFQAAGYSQLGINGTAAFNCISAGNTSIKIDGGVLGSLAAGQTITTDHNMGAGKSTVTVWGYEVDA